MGNIGVPIGDELRADSVRTVPRDRVDVWPVGHTFMHDRQESRGPGALRHERFDTANPDTARRFFLGAYSPGWRITGFPAGSTVTHRRCDAGAIILDEVAIQGKADCEIPAADSVLVVQPRGGSLIATGGPFPVADCPVLIAHGAPCVLQLNGAQFDVVSVAADVLHKVAADWHAPLPQPVQFSDRRPRSRAAVRALHRVLDYVTATLGSADTAQQPLIAAAAARLLAAVLLECYPSNANEQNVLADPGLPEALKDAVSYIHCHAGGDVGINDVAAAVHLTPRAVQYLFRRELDTTPTEYARRVRLHRAHQELIASDRSSATVSEIAQRWGFAHTGRFAVLYRETYGQSPHATLKE